MGRAAEENKKSQADRIADQIKENQKRKEQRKFHEEWKKRISIAREGRMAFERKNHVQAVRMYQKFLALTAKAMDCELKNLKPSMFPKNSRVSECLLISAITFDLAKIFDQMRTKDADKTRAIYLNLFIRFTSGQPFQVLVAEQLRKFLKYTSTVKHKNEFNSALKQIYKQKGGACYVATKIYHSPHAYEVEVLREIRDRHLARYRLGRQFICLYYQFGSNMAESLDWVPIFKPLLKSLLDSLVYFYDKATTESLWRYVQVEIEGSKNQLQG